MNGHDGNVSPPASLRAGTGPISSSAAVPSGASAGGRGMMRGNKPAFAGGSSAAIVGSPPHSSKRIKGRKAEAEGGEMKKTAVFDHSSRCWLCPQCRKPFPSRHGVYGHMPVHNRPLKLGKVVASISNKTEGSDARSVASSAVATHRQKIHAELDLNKEAPEDDENDD